MALFAICIAASVPYVLPYKQVFFNLWHPRGYMSATLPVRDGNASTDNLIRKSRAVLDADQFIVGRQVLSFFDV